MGYSDFAARKMHISVLKITQYVCATQRGADISILTLKNCQFKVFTAKSRVKATKNECTYKGRRKNLAQNTLFALHNKFE